MDKPRWFVTWCLACGAADITYTWGFWKSQLVVIPFAIVVCAIENYRSSKQNGEQ
jgi:hypothetical protein